MKVADYIPALLVESGIHDVFLVTGGAIAQLVDAIGRRAEYEKDFTYTVVQHEQAGAMAAEGYARFAKSGIGVACATSGPGATNLITGMCGCWFDSIPGLFITGQVGTKEDTGTVETKPRQIGFQETDIVSIVKPITKYAVQVRDPSRIKYEIQKAIAIAKSGRPGPVLLDIPIDVQTAQVEPNELESYELPSADGGISDEVVQTVRRHLEEAKRPVLLIGGGVRLAGATEVAEKLIETLKIPTVVSWSGFDGIAHESPYFCGHIGVYGARGANLVIQNADLVLSVGSRLDTRQTGGRVNTFARGAKKIMVDIDPEEVHKDRGVTIDVPIVADAKVFMTDLLACMQDGVTETRDEWLSYAKDCAHTYNDPEGVSHTTDDEPINAYAAVRVLSKHTSEGDTIIVDEGGNLVWTMQALIKKAGQRIVSTFGNSPMGYALPAAIGAAVAQPGKNILCIDGDGGFQMNIQELQTLANYQLPVKVILLNNRTMGIINQFQDLYFESRRYAAAPGFGYSVPDFEKVAQAYGVNAWTVEKYSELEAAYKTLFETPGPGLLNIHIDVAQRLEPKLEFGRPIEDMSPYMDRADLKARMKVPLLPESEEIPKNTGWVDLK